MGSEVTSPELGAKMGQRQNPCLALMLSSQLLAATLP